jgi:cytochrome c oxidase subunit 1
MYGGKLRLATPMLFCLAFLFQFLISGLTGVMLGVTPFDWQLTDSYFVVGHFHYVLVGGLAFAVFGGFYYWFPKVFGKMLSEFWGKVHFWLFVVGFNLTFAPMHWLGFYGMPRRTYTYAPGRGWEFLNLLCTLGVIFQALSVLAFLWNVVSSLRSGAEAGDDPWDAWTLEWTTSSPPPEYNFEKLPVVRSSRPLWDLKHPQDPDWKYE